ncbi:hypothetical protein PBI_TEAMOCIL_62 [Microbacterium phage Teamocil]|uniref:Uncharacterized protein n=1 Tax=Microbacterium phage Teamocil TaxID=2656554 RepID=A0A649VXP9_9CAUD|nr:hypothetical protein QDA12_gp62 [Microbacterium phage Teamocil]QGJ97048.1 hypothetical protein PBI_TEAMOCIL_62 [Microbacterium phage Teamocil]
MPSTATRSESSRASETASGRGAPPPPPGCSGEIAAGERRGSGPAIGEAGPHSPYRNLNRSAVRTS